MKRYHVHVHHARRLTVAALFVLAGGSLMTSACSHPPDSVASCDGIECGSQGAPDAGDVVAAPDMGSDDDLGPHHGGGDAGFGFADGGKPAPQWWTSSAGSNGLAYVYGASASEVYVTGQHCTLMRSVDRGRSWKPIALPDCMADSQFYLGIGGGMPGFYSIVGIWSKDVLSVPHSTIYWTADSWATASWQVDISWDAVPQALLAIGSTSTMQFSLDTQGKVIYSDNGGERWRSTSATGLSRGGDIGAVTVLSAKEVWVAGERNGTNTIEAALSHTLDGGSTWSVTPLSAFPNALGSENQMTAVYNAQGTLWTSTISGRFYKSTDDGATWHGPVLTTGLGASQFWSSDRNNVYAIVGASIMHTPDGGKTWSQEASDLVTGNLSSIWGSAADDIYVVGANGLILRYSTTGD